MSRMVDATIALIVGTFITLAYWFALAGPLNVITAGIDAVKGASLFTGRNSGGAAVWSQFTGLTTNIFGVWLISTLVAYLIMYIWEATRVEDVTREVAY